MTVLDLKRAADAFPDAGWPRRDTDWVVLCEARIIGRIRGVENGRRTGAWEWTITAVAPWIVGTHSGSEPDLICAQAAFKTAWEQTPESDRVFLVAAQRRSD